MSYTASHYKSLSFDDDGSLIVHSSKTGGLGVIPPENAERARDLLRPGTVIDGPLDDLGQALLEGGLIVEDSTVERQEVHDSYVSRYSADVLHLIIMPTEDCNFRCVYCYESFLRGTMSQEVQDAILKNIESRTNLKAIEISWFGGEPLIASEVVIDLMARIGAHCRKSGISLRSNATTNGYSLTPEIATRIIELGITNFQITLDGVSHEHDKRRVGRNGEATFETILENLRWLRSSELEFNVMLRHNFDPDGLPHLEEFLTMLGSEFGQDERFACSFEAIGRWGGETDDSLVVCEDRDATRAISSAKRLALSKGLRDAATLNQLQPGGAVCYAANPYSFVIGSDGTLYKCTVELDYHDRNIVGRLLPSGEMDLDWRKMALWTETNGLREGTKCSTCWFSPGCHGAICPKEWMDDNDVTCPPAKQNIHDSLTFIRLEAVTFGPPDPEPVAQCVR